MKHNDTDLILYADGLLDPERKERLLQTAANDPNLADTLAALDASRLPFKAAFDQQHMPKVPDKLRNDLHNLTRVTRELGVAPANQASKRRRLPIILAQAACLALCVILGFVAGKTPLTKQWTAGTNQHDRSLDHIAWVERVHNYQSLYVPNTTAFIKADWTVANRTLERLNDTANVKAAIPDLSSAGYEFVRVQELGYQGRPVVQLVYNKKGKPPLALCLMPSNNESDATVRVTNHADLSVADWIADNQRFALVADESSVTLEQLFAIIRAEFSRV
jgi:anti-sigma factor RsiW